MASAVLAVKRTSDQTSQTEGQFGDLSCEAWLRIRNKLRLSDRELAVVQGVCWNRDEAAIASMMAVSRDIVYRTVQRVYVKLRIGSRIELRARVMSEYLNPDLRP
jgi:DNA-binding NarL/FixJ family response regulator